MVARREFIFLGTGTSVGVPMIGCECAVCTSPNTRNHRTRSSVLLKVPGGNLLIDTGPEMRLQLVREKIPVAHAILFTHYHADHLFGLDDARLFPKRLGHSVPIYCEDDVEEVIRTTFSYAFHAPNPANGPSMLLPQIEFHRITEEPFSILGEECIPIRFEHGRFRVLGFRFGNIAYCTDVSGIPTQSWPLLEGLDVLVLDALRPGTPHPAHFSLDQALEVVNAVRPKQTYLTHMGHEMEYDHLCATLPPQVAPAYDGLRFEF
jgi:phosphoribosyl 1,2-cyclic phosphate phosphodiesterase